MICLCNDGARSNLIEYKTKVHLNRFPIILPISFNLLTTVIAHPNQCPNYIFP